MQQIVHNPVDGIHAATPDYVHALAVRRAERFLAEASMTTDNIVRLTNYLRDPSYAAANGAARERALGSRRIPTTAIVVQTLDAAWLVEIEAIAVA